MITLDGSALIAVLRGEQDAEDLLRLMAEADDIQISAATYLEAAIVIDGFGDPVLSARFDEFVESLGVTIAPVTADQAQRARTAYRDYGRGSGHPARLNYGDVVGYALATTTRTPLLFTGDDFGHTDVRPAR